MIGFVINPVSGNGRGAKVWKRVEKELRKRGIPHEARFTTGAGDAERIAREMAKSGRIQAIAAVGGDGTVNEAVTGLVTAGPLSSTAMETRGLASPGDCSFGYIPAGSGNDFARSNGIPEDPIAALDLLLGAVLEDSSVDLDLLQLGHTVAASSISCGFDAQVALTTNEASYKRWLNLFGAGKLAYVLSVIRVLFTYRPQAITLRVDGWESRFEQVWLVAMCNLPYYGGGFRINPDADATDGLASVCVAFGITRWQLLRLFPLVLSGKHVGHPAVRFFTGKRIELLPESPLPIQADGDPVQEERIRIEVIPGLLPVALPRAVRSRSDSRPDCPIDEPA
ncbi:diacylglycerol/lipid kinase family protein [Gorillibacterium timonense]|uniref:diacylglycerol/lipid kinase family protein n=1 Tax=Gorillibacterium timonense TaxID=1689269 RepID=UPI00071DCD31|nr:diacylglycerol kinase family protein [Gorillibacterium timonense]